MLISTTKDAQDTVFRLVFEWLKASLPPGRKPNMKSRMRDVLSKSRYLKTCDGLEIELSALSGRNVVLSGEFRQANFGVDIQTFILNTADLVLASPRRRGGTSIASTFSAAAEKRAREA